MYAVTIEVLVQKHTELGELIEKYKAEAPKQLAIPAASIELRAGERYAGTILNDDGTVSHHVILLADKADGMTWSEAKEWAEKVGGDLPSRREQSLLFANLKTEFESAYYWSGEQYDADYAWGQDFSSGGQYYGCKLIKARVRAVRRFNA